LQRAKREGRSLNKNHGEEKKKIILSLEKQGEKKNNHGKSTLNRKKGGQRDLRVHHKGGHRPAKTRFMPAKQACWQKAGKEGRSENASSVSV